MSVPTHLRFIAILPCCRCGNNTGCQAHHLLSTRRRGIARKAPDWHTIPLCPSCHRELHDDGDEERVFATWRINGEWLAGALWTLSRGSADYGAAEGLIEIARY